MDNIQKLLQMRQRRTQLKNDAEALLDTAEAENRNLTASEQRQYSDILAKIEKIRHDEDAHIVANGLQGELAEGSPVASRDTSFLGNDVEERAKVGPTTDKTYRGMFRRGREHESLSNGGFASWDEFVDVIASGRYDPRLTRVSERRTISTFQSEGVPSEGGYLVPQEHAGWLLDKSLESEIIRPRCQVFPMQSASLKAGAWDNSDHSENLYSGWTGQWLSEGGEASREKAKVRMIGLSAKKLAIFCDASREMVQDGISFGDQLQTAMAKAIGWFVDLALIRGTGAGQPLGILNSPSLVTVSKQTNQTGDTINYSNLCDMFSRLAPQCIENSIWLASPTAIPELLQLSHAVGTGGSIVPVLTGSTGNFSLLTRPIVFSEKASALGDAGDIILFDPSQYVVGLRQEISLETSLAPGWSQDLVSFRAIIRMDGQAVWDSEITPRYGDSQSWAVTLEDRT